MRFTVTNPKNIFKEEKYGILKNEIVWGLLVCRFKLVLIRNNT
jgi:hypothetical protein